MSKAEEKANEYAEKVMLCVNHRLDVRDAYWDGYEQAEKDLALTWEDVETINRLTSEVCSEFFGDPCGSEDFDREKTYTEVLRRYNERKQ